MKSKLKLAVGCSAIAFALQASAEVTFFEGEGFSGRSFTADRRVENFDQTGFNDRASSAIVNGGSWQICSDAEFQGRCVVLQPGSYPSLSDFHLDRRVSSVRPAQSYERDIRGDADDGRDFNAGGVPVAAAPSAYRKGGDERLYEVDVSSVHAVMGSPQQRCWVEREQVVNNGSADLNVPGAIIGGVIGGVLGHQVGGGRGQDIATGVGAVGGAAVGANVGRGSGSSGYSQDVQRCEQAPNSARPAYWDVTYSFGGNEHRVQMTTPPGPTIMVNVQGEPRV